MRQKCQYLSIHMSLQYMSVGILFLAILARIPL